MGGPQPGASRFGGDSAVELLSAAVVLWRFHSPSSGDHAEHRASIIAGGLLFLLAGFVALASVLTLVVHIEARPIPVGIVLLILAAVIMPWLRQLSAATASAALRADAAEFAVCGYLALIALAGLVVNAIWRGRVRQTPLPPYPAAADCARGEGGDEGRAVLRCGLSRWAASVLVQFVQGPQSRRTSDLACRQDCAAPASQYSLPNLLQLRVLRLCSDEDGDVGVGMFLER